ncbi:SCO6745 family protein [Nocardioides perillae]|uniref:SalK n=1 Tax=Nocardioides perillae TaxID=1119534 RepID=A0A7Y9RWD9_9ACTN|nr:hypothetical protein [Nocardioides perillae]NYG56524.1 hypothetical protein [Nocardioides perillae]
MTTPTPRELFAVFEPLHVVTYFAPQAREATEAAGLRGYWRGYFAGRAAALGRAPATTVTALFHGFAPAVVERAIPSVWDLCAPEDALRARLAGAVAALRALDLDAASVAEAAELASQAARSADHGGRALGAAEAAQPWPVDPLARLWRAATVLREVRGDGHVAALVAAELSGLDALALRAGRDLERAPLQAARGWSDAQWDAAVAGLQARALLDADARTTEAGTTLLDGVEATTDRLAAQPWRVVGEAGAARFRALAGPLAAAALAAYPGAAAMGLAPRAGG